MARVLSTKEFDAWENLLPKDYKGQLQGFIEELKQNCNTGKPLGYPFFREKKMGKYRVYFLVYKDIDTALLVTISDKKAQQDVIDDIKSQLEHYKEIIRKSL